LLVCAAMVAAAGMITPTASDQKRLLRLMFDGPVTESPKPGDLAMLMGEKQANSLKEWVDTIDRAAGDAKIDGAVMFINGPSVGLSQVEELTRAIKRFRERGKKVWCYMDYADNSSYALACAADHITLTEASELSVLGLHAEMMFYKNLFDKVGITADMMHVGDFKSALEPYTRTEPSPEAAEQVNWLLDSIYARFVSLLAEGRGLSEEQIREAIDNAPLMAADALERKMIDAVAPLPEFKKSIQKEYGKEAELVMDYGSKKNELDLDFNNPFALFQKFQEILSPAVEEPKPGIGVVYIDGMIVMGETQQGLFASASAGSSTIRSALEKARNDDQIKAVVVRVDSPGGSALASEIIWDAAARCASEKPLVVSMGNVAGSGGYYVAVPGDVIFAEKSTITGSIGVVGGKLVFSGLTDWAGLTFTEFKRGKHADLYSTNRVWTEPERELVRDYMLKIYDQFKQRVKQSRGDRIKGDLESLAGGRVYTGQQALEIGLVDKIGGLADAMAYAAKKANLSGDYEVYTLPKSKGLMEVIAEAFGKSTDDPWAVSSPGLRLFGDDAVMQRFLPVLRQLAPEQAAQAVIGLHKAMILNREHAALFMPLDLSIR
jgi:protease-4